MPHELTADEIESIHYQLVDFFAKGKDPIFPAGVKTPGLLQSAAHRPLTGYGGQEKYRDIEARAAALFHSLIKNHPFHNGNKRTALVATLSYLDRNRRWISASDTELFDFVVSVAANRQPFDGDTDHVVDEIRTWIRGHCAVRQAQYGEMDILEFLAAVASLGGVYRENGRGNSWVVMGKEGKRLNISRATKHLAGNVVKKYLTNLRLSANQEGGYLEECQDGIAGEQKVIRQYRKVLKQLANA